MKKSKGIVSLVLIAALLGLLGFTCWQGFGSSHTGSARNINLGLDLAGGVSITYQTKDKNPSAEDMKDTIYKLQKRVEQYSTEAQVYQEGSDRITVEIPGVTDADTILNASSFVMKYREPGLPRSFKIVSASVTPGISTVIRSDPSWYT